MSEMFPAPTGLADTESLFTTMAGTVAFSEGESEALCFSHISPGVACWEALLGAPSPGAADREALCGSPEREALCFIHSSPGEAVREALFCAPSGDVSLKDALFAPAGLSGVSFGPVTDGLFHTD